MKNKSISIPKKSTKEIFAHVQRLDWSDGTIPSTNDDCEMNMDEFQEALVAVALIVDPSPFRALDQRIENGIEIILGMSDNE
jgi:hypothetical protein